MSFYLSLSNSFPIGVANKKCRHAYSLLKGALSVNHLHRIPGKSAAYQFLV